MTANRSDADAPNQHQSADAVVTGSGESVQSDHAREGLISSSSPQVMEDLIAKLPRWELLPDEPWMERRAIGKWVRADDLKKAALALGSPSSGEGQAHTYDRSCAAIMALQPNPPTPSPSPAATRTADLDDTGQFCACSCIHTRREINRLRAALSRLASGEAQ